MFGCHHALTLSCPKHRLKIQLESYWWLIICVGCFILLDMNWVLHMEVLQQMFWYTWKLNQNTNFWLYFSWYGSNCMIRTCNKLDNFSFELILWHALNLLITSLWLLSTKETYDFYNVHNFRTLSNWYILSFKKCVQFITFNYIVLIITYGCKDYNRKCFKTTQC